MNGPDVERAPKAATKVIKHPGRLTTTQQQLGDCIMAKRIVPTTSAPSIHTEDVVRVAEEITFSMEVFFDLVEREIQMASHPDFNNIAFLIKGARAEIERLQAALFPVGDKPESA